MLFATSGLQHPSSSSTNKNAALIIDHWLDFTKLGIAIGDKGIENQPRLKNFNLNLILTCIL